MGMGNVFLAALMGAVASLLINLWIKSQEDRKQVEEKKKSFGTCPLCGGSLGWEDDIMASDAGFDISEGDYIVSLWRCQKCGAFVEIQDINNRTTVPTEE